MLLEDCRELGRGNVQLYAPETSVSDLRASVLDQSLTFSKIRWKSSTRRDVQLNITHSR